jgi:hypothetical protein
MPKAIQQKLTYNLELRSILHAWCAYPVSRPVTLSSKPVETDFTNDLTFYKEYVKENDKIIQSIGISLDAQNNVVYEGQFKDEKFHG